MEAQPATEVEAAPLEPETIAGLGRLATAGAIGMAGAAGTALFGWLRAKGLALTLGPSGVGIYGQIWSLVLYAGQLASLGIGVGATALIAAEYERGDREALSLSSSLSLMLPVLAGLALLFLILLASPLLAPLLLDSSDVLLLGIAALSVPFAAVQIPLQHVIQGLEDVVGQTVAYLVYGASFTILAVAGALIADVEGAALGLLLGNVVLAGLYLARSRRLLERAGASLRTGLAVVRGGLRSKSAGILLRIGAASLAVTVAFGLADLTVRTVLLQGEGEEVAGYWYALLLISVQFIGVLAAALSWLTAPLAARLAERGDQEGVRRVLDDSLRLVCVTVLPVLALLCALRDPVVNALFSSEFSPVADHLPAQFAGDAMRSLAWTLGVVLIPLGYVSAWLIVGVGASILFGVAGGLLASHSGLDGAVTAWVAMWAASLIGTAIVVARAGAWRPTTRSLIGVAIGAAALGAATVSPGASGALLSAVAFAMGVLLVTTSEERREAAAWLRRRARPDG
jgi:O-antigen/teichoic acid export membrane protein